MLWSSDKSVLRYRDRGRRIGGIIDFSLEPVDGEVSLFNKTADDLQADIVIGEDSISGTLKYVTGYTGFSSSVSEQSGNYLALKFDPTPVDAEVTVEIVGGTKGPVTLDEDKMWVGLIKSTSQKVKVTVTSGKDVKEATYSLSNLTLTPAE